MKSSAAAHGSHRPDERWGDCDLLDRLAGEPSFGLSRGDMERLLNQELYTGRCAQQVEDFVQSIRPLFADLERETARIEL